jgi:guanine deaminase
MEETLMQRVVEIAGEGVKNGNGGPFASLVVHNGKIIAESCNMVFTTNDPTAHAEIMAIRLASQELGTAELNDCELYSLGEPCPMCMAAIYWAGIDKVYFANTKEEAANVGFDDSFIYRELSLAFDQRTLEIKHFPNENAKRLFSDWDCCVDKTGRPQT